MKSMKRFLALLLTLLMLMTVFTACASEEPTPDASDSGVNNSDQGNSGDEGDGGEEEIVEITYLARDNSGAASAGKYYDDVVAAINAITEKEIGVHVNFEWVNFADNTTQITLAAANNEDAYDLVECGNDFLQFAYNGGLLDITDLVETYGQDLKAAVGDVLNGYYVGDSLYGIPVHRVMNGNMYLCFRTDILESVGMLDTFNSMTCWDDLSVVLQAIKDQSDVYGIGAVGFMRGFIPEENFSDMISYDYLGDGTYFVMSDQSGNVSNVFENESVIEYMKLWKDWLDAGYIHPESAYSKDVVGDEGVKYGLNAGFPSGAEFGVEAQRYNRTGYKMECLEICSGMLSSALTQKIGYAIPANAAEPEAAMKFLNLAYTNADLMNLMDWGIEGKTYEINDEGEACFPEGTDASSCGWFRNDYSFGNQFLALPAEGQGGDFRERAMENFRTAPVSAYMGLSMQNSSEMNTLITQLVAVRDEYVNQLTSGLYSDELYAEFMAKADAAGIDDYLAIYQTAVNDFMA